MELGVWIQLFHHIILDPGNEAALVKTHVADAEFAFKVRGTHRCFRSLHTQEVSAPAGRRKRRRTGDLQKVSPAHTEINFTVHG